MKKFWQWLTVPAGKYYVQTSETEEERWERLHRKPQRESFKDLEGSSWTMHADQGRVFLSGDDGTVQAQFMPYTAIRISEALAEAGLRAQEQISRI